MGWRCRDLIASLTLSLNVVSAEWLPATILCQWIEKNEAFLIYKVALRSCPELISGFLFYHCFQSKLAIFASSFSLCYASPKTCPDSADAYSWLTNSSLFSLSVTKIFRSLQVSDFPVSWISAFSVSPTSDQLFSYCFDSLLWRSWDLQPISSLPSCLPQPICVCCHKQYSGEKL